MRIRKRGGKWNVQVEHGDFYRSGTFTTKLLAQAFGRKAETEYESGIAGTSPALPFSDAMERYAREVSSTKRGERWERIRLTMLSKEAIGKVLLSNLGATDVAKWRDERLKHVSAPSVNREWNLLSHVCSIALQEWRWLQHNPFKDVRRPAKGKARDRIPTDAEIEAIKLAGGYHDGMLTTDTSRVVAAFLFAIETAMRSGEICSLRDVRGNVAYLEKTKNGEARQVPLSTEALRILAQLPEGHFDLADASRDALWRKIRKRANVEGLTFHDSRHLAITRLATIKKLDVLDLARMTGHKNIRELMTYYNESAENIAKKLG